VNDIARLRWQCRRGTKELDLLLLDYLDNRYPAAHPEQQQRFCEILKLDDSELLTNPWFIKELVKPKLLKADSLIPL
jgi:antitoxin CptB